MPTLLDRFLRYVQIDTQSCETGTTVPSTLKQLDLSRAQRHTPWYGIWVEGFRLDMVKAIAGETKLDDMLKSMTEKLTALKKTGLFAVK